MSNYYDINAINFIFYRFKVKNVIFIGSFKGIDQIQEYCNDNNIAYKFIDLNEDNANNISEHIPLNKLKNIQNYDAIFLNDDAGIQTPEIKLNKVFMQSGFRFPHISSFVILGICTVGKIRSLFIWNNLPVKISLFY